MSLVDEVLRLTILVLFAFGVFFYLVLASRSRTHVSVWRGVCMNLLMEIASKSVSMRAARSHQVSMKKNARKLVKRCAWGNGRVNFRIIWDMSLGPRGKTKNRIRGLITIDQNSRLGPSEN